jgi:hypothetical protein
MRAIVPSLSLLAALLVLACSCASTEMQNHPTAVPAAEVAHDGGGVPAANKAAIPLAEVQIVFQPAAPMRSDAWPPKDAGSVEETRDEPIGGATVDRAVLGESWRLFPCSPEATLVDAEAITGRWMSDSVLILNGVGSGHWMAAFRGYAGIEYVDFEVPAGSTQVVVNVRSNARGTVRVEGFHPGKRLTLVREPPDLHPYRTGSQFAWRSVTRTVTVESERHIPTIRVEPGLYRVEQGTLMKDLGWIRVSTRKEVVIRPRETEVAYLQWGPQPPDATWCLYVKESNSDEEGAASAWRIAVRALESRGKCEVLAGRVEWCLVGGGTVMGRGELEVAPGEVRALVL